MKRNWFTAGGQEYARFRPQYPASLAQYVAGLVPQTDRALDVGCGSGQLTRQLAPHFDHVVGLDPSLTQLLHAHTVPNGDYVCAAAESLPLANTCASLITVAQAAHWLDLPRFYKEVRRVGKDGGILALISYGVLQFTRDTGLDGRFSQFYHSEIGPYWPAERALIDTGYADLPFPFAEMQAPVLTMKKHWSLSQFLGYISTWSAVLRARDAAQHQLLQQFSSDLARLWADPMEKKRISWPVHMRIGTIER